MLQHDLFPSLLLSIVESEPESKVHEQGVFFVATVGYYAPENLLLQLIEDDMNYFMALMSGLKI